MNFLALLLGLGLERALTSLFHLRAFHWLDPVFDAVLRRLHRAGRPALIPVLVLLACGLALPVLYAAGALAGDPGALFVFSILVLLFSLGPRDLQQEVREYCAALDDGAAEQAQRLAQELAERDLGTDPAVVATAAQRAIFVQANNRIFCVVFWFLVSGPTGAWLFRVLDLLRQRAALAFPGTGAAEAARRLHGVAAWLPGRLMASAFALAGSFAGAAAAWRLHRAGARAPEFFRRTEDLVAGVGRGACAAEAGPDLAPAPASRAALALVRRALWLVWYPAVALLTLGNWLQ
jgi:AmpE protein